MANYENIKLRKRNFTVIDGYFYTIDEDTDSLVVKTDDGLHAFTYPLAVTMDRQVLSLEYDGRNFWSLEDSGTGYVVIKRWYIDNYVCKLRNEFSTVAWGDTHKCQSEAFTVEHYHIKFASNESLGSNNISITDGSNLSNGITITFGPNSSGNIEEFTVLNYGSDYVIINGSLKYSYNAGDPICFYKNIWIFNNYNGLIQNAGALYKMNAYTGSYVNKIIGGEFYGIKACTFYDLSTVINGWSDSICYVKASNMLFLNPKDFNNSFGSMSLDNIEANQSTVILIYDISIDYTNIYRLQLKATYSGTTESWSNYSYQLSTLNSFITSISLKAEPGIIPANGVSNSTITAVVKDQFNRPVVGKAVYFSDNDPNGYLFNNTNDVDSGTIYKLTDTKGVAAIGYKSGTTAREVTVTATAQQG